MGGRAPLTSPGRHVSVSRDFTWSPPACAVGGDTCVCGPPWLDRERRCRSRRPTMAVDQIKRLYDSMPARLDEARRRFGRGLTLAEKILVAHADDFGRQEWSRGKAQLRLRVDRVALQDATGQMALLQFMQAGKKQVAVPSTVHCDHLIRAESGASADMERAIAENREVYDFLHSTSKKYGIGFWKPGAGIIHQVVLENYAFPGGLMIGADSHTPNAGGHGRARVGGARSQADRRAPHRQALRLELAQGRHHLSLRAADRQGRDQQ